MLMYQKEEVLPRMRGLWPQAFVSLCNVDKSHFNKKHGPCMYCGGTDRARFTDKIQDSGDGGYICAQCGGDTGIGWFSRMRGESYSEAINSLGEWLNLVPVEIINKANKQASRAPAFRVGAQADNESCEKVMQRCQKLTSTVLSVSEGFFGESFDVGVKVDSDGVEEQFHCIPCYMVQQDGLEDEMCNILIIDEQANQKLMARDYTRGSVTVTNQGEGAIYLVTDWIDAQHVAISTGREVWNCFSPSNLEIVAHRYKGDREMRVAALIDDKEVIYMADDRDLKVIIPYGHGFKSGMRRQLFTARELLNK